MQSRVSLDGSGSFWMKEFSTGNHPFRRKRMRKWGVREKKELMDFVSEKSSPPGPLIYDPYKMFLHTHLVNHNEENASPLIPINFSANGEKFSKIFTVEEKYSKNGPDPIQPANLPCHHQLRNPEKNSKKLLWMRKFAFLLRHHRS